MALFFICAVCLNFVSHRHRFLVFPIYNRNKKGRMSCAGLTDLGSLIEFFDLIIDDEGHNC